MQSTPINPYQAPEQMTPLVPTGTVYIQNSCLLVPREYSFPPICMKTGATENLGKPITKAVAWYHPAWACLLLLNLLIFIIVVLCIQKRGKVTFYLSQEARKKRRGRLLINWLVFLSAVPLFYLASIQPDYAQYAILGAVFAILTSLILAATWSRLLAPRRIDEQFIYFSFKDPILLEKIYTACMQQVHPGH